jgi:hypothetical protein
MNNIIIVKRINVYYASVVNHKEIWGCGKTKKEALGDLIMSYKNIFKLNVEIK